MRTHVQVLLAALLVIIGGWVGYTVMFGPEAVIGLTLVEVRGDVKRTDSAGQAQDVAVGVVLGVRDTVSVPQGGSAVLGVGEGTRISLGEASAVRVLDVDAEGVRVELEQGRVSARVATGSASVDVASRGRTVRTDDGAFTIVADEDGTVAVDAEGGTVGLDGFGVQDALAQGQRLSAVPDRPPVVGAIPDQLLLEVTWPEQTPRRAPEAPVSGRTEPYARVRVGGEGSWETVRADAEGHFQVSVPLEEGDNVVNVEATDVSGEATSTDGRIERDTTAPVVSSTEVVWGG